MTVGDKVKVRSDLTPYKLYAGNCSYNDEMREYAGRELTIADIYTDGTCSVKENDWRWSIEMFEPNKQGDTIHPNYYIFHDYDVFDIADYFKMSFPQANALKYLIRAGHKNGASKIQDFQKCIQCLQRAIELEK